jgi:hypothetical protein
MISFNTQYLRGDNPLPIMFERETMATIVISHYTILVLSLPNLDTLVYIDSRGEAEA